MAKRLSKALRGKRRWVGVGFPSAIQDRSDAVSVIEAAFAHIRTEKGIRLMDFHEHSSAQGQTTQHHLEAEGSPIEPLSYGVLQVPHEIYSQVLELTRAEDSLKNRSIFSITSSGKIRLVRERLGLVRPPRRR